MEYIKNFDVQITAIFKRNISSIESTLRRYIDWDDFEYETIPHENNYEKIKSFLKHVIHQINQKEIK